MEVLDEFLTLQRQLVLRLLLPTVELDDVLRNVAQLVVREVQFDFFLRILRYILGEILQLRDGLSDTECVARQYNKEYQEHQRHEVNEFAIDLQRILNVRTIRDGASVDISFNVIGRIEILLPIRARRPDSVCVHLLPCLEHLAPIVMIIPDIALGVVEQDFPARVDDRYAQAVFGDFPNEFFDYGIQIRVLLHTVV